MNGTNDKKIGIGDTGEAKEEKEFFAREEVKTLEKDVSRLREAEASKERERLAKIKTGEEIVREKVRDEQAKQAALERERAEKEAEEREERVEIIKKERGVQEKTLQATETREGELKTKGLRDALKETQTREEEERKRFLARIEARIENKEEAPLPPPPTPPAPQEIPRIPFRKPSSSQKLWVRIVLSLLVVAIIAVIVTFFYWYFVIREKPEESPVTPEVKEELVIPPALFYAESAQTLQVSEISEIPAKLSQVLQEKIDQGSTSRILIEDTKNNQILELQDFFGAFTTSSPEGFYDKLENDFTLFIYSQEQGNRLGLVAEIKDAEILAKTLTSWEGTMEKDLEKLFELLGKDKPALVSYFKNAKYQDANFRFQTFSRNDLGIVYTIYSNYFILTTSGASMEKVLDKLKENPTI